MRDLDPHGLVNSARMLQLLICYDDDMLRNKSHILHVASPHYVFDEW